MIEVTQHNFDAEVKSCDVPVVIDFWAPHCGPCKNIHVILEQLEESYGTRIKVASVNIEREQLLARAFNVRSVPTVLALVGGNIKDSSVGFRGELALREMFDKLVSP